MKMPTRPFYPPLESRPDIFGLHHLTILGQACESDEQRQQRIAKVQHGVIAAFKAAVSHLGEDQARKLFAKAARKPKRGRGKTLAADRDHRLLAAYDEAVVKNGETVAVLSRRLRNEGIELGNTASAIATQIRELVKERKERAGAAAFEARRWRMAMRNAPPTILGAAIAKK